MTAGPAALPDEPLRRRALHHLGPRADARGVAALESGMLVVEGIERTWQGTRGPALGLRVALRVDDAVAGALRAAPAVWDALVAAVAAALAERPATSLTTLVLAPPSASGATAAAGPYR